jgi:hypothetical protein
MRDKGRFALALLFAMVFALTVLIALAVGAWGTAEARTTINGLLPVLLPAELTLLTAAAAFYFTGGDREPKP